MRKTQGKIWIITIAITISAITLPIFFLQDSDESIFQYFGITDNDSDGLTDASDNCPRISNPSQLDSDQDTLGDKCDIDDDNDGIIDVIDMFDTDPKEWIDTDNDKIGDNSDLDDDNDKIVDAIDAFDLDQSEWADFDFDGVGANKDTDDDNDGILDVDDSTPSLPSKEMIEKYLPELKKCTEVNAGTPRLLCYGNFFDMLTENEKNNSNVVRLAVDLSKLGAIDDCHFVSHEIGHVAFDENPDVFSNLLGMDSSLCRGGFYHGVMSSYFHDVKENNDSLPEYKLICNELLGSPNYQDCVHGLGHGFVHYYLDDLESSVNSCHEMSFYQGSLCIGGVMMQYTDNNLVRSSTWEQDIPEMCSKTDLSEIDYHQCNVSLGLSLAYHTDHNLESGQQFCNVINDQVGRNACLLGLSEEIKNSVEYVKNPLTNEIRQKFQPQWITNNIIDILTPAIVSEFEFVEDTGFMKFSIDRPGEVIIYLTQDILPQKNAALTLNGKTADDVSFANTVFGEKILMIRFIAYEPGIVLFTPVD